MEYELWAGKYQQSVPQVSSERSDDNLNNGNSEEDGETNPKAGEEDGEGAVKVENEQDSAPATISVRLVFNLNTFIYSLIYIPLEVEHLLNKQTVVLRLDELCFPNCY